MVLSGVSDGDTAEARIAFYPLVMWVWVGAVIMTIGGLIVMWPQSTQRRPQSGYAAVLEPQEASA